MKKSRFISFLLAIVLTLPVCIVPINAANGKGTLSDFLAVVNKQKIGTPGTDYQAWAGIGGEAWCAVFVAYCAKEAKILNDVIPYDTTASGMYEKLTKKIEDGGLGGEVKEQPQAGDLVFYICSYCKINNPIMKCPHVGIMISATESIEGNISEKVDKLEHPYNSKGHCFNDERHIHEVNGQYKYCIEEIYVHPCFHTYNNDGLCSKCEKKFEFEYTPVSLKMEVITNDTEGCKIPDKKTGFICYLKGMTINVVQQTTDRNNNVWYKSDIRLNDGSDIWIMASNLKFIDDNNIAVTTVAHRDLSSTNVVLEGRIKSVNKDDTVRCGFLLGEAKNSSSKVQDGVKEIYFPEIISFPALKKNDYKFSCDVSAEAKTPLKPNTKYYYQAYAVNKNGNTIFGEPATFTTLKPYEVMVTARQYNAPLYVTFLSNTNFPSDTETANNDPNARGNSVGNIVNGGFVATQGDWIYYKNNEDGQLYKIHINGSGKTKLTEKCIKNSSMVPLYINVINDWVYYSASSYKEDKFISTISKVRTDGTNETIVTDDNVYDLNVVGDWIYYRNGSDNDKLYKIRTDGTKKTKLNDESSGFINVVGDWIYYVTNGSNSSIVYKIRVDGSQKTKVFEVNEYAAVPIVVGDWIYYIKWLDEYQIYKVRTDGTQRTKITNDDYCLHLNVVDDWIYYTKNQKPDAGNIYKIRTDGTNETKLNDERCKDIIIINDWIYYYVTSDSGVNQGFYKMRTDGTQRQLVD